MILSENQALQAQINTRSNYRGLNDKWLLVKEIKGRRITCTISTIENITHGEIDIDFTLDEVMGFRDGYK